jgi:proline dehydrogenase
MLAGPGGDRLNQIFRPELPAGLPAVGRRNLFSMIYRQGVLGVAGLKPVERLMRRLGFRIGVGRFVAGESLSEAIAALQRLEAAGLAGILDLLGEFIDTRAGVDDMVNQILVTLDALAQHDLQRYMSVKPTQLGLGLDTQLALGNSRAVALRAAGAGAQVCLDMESHEHVDGTLELFRTLHADGHQHVSTVLQAYLHRTESDLAALATLEPRPVLRFVKGAYLEPASVAWQDKAKVDMQLRKLVFTALEGGIHTNIATHDEKLINETRDFIRSNNVPAEQYEYQLLYGVKPRLQAQLAAEGHTVRIYVPYGHDWYGYFSRRLAERPANLAFVVRGLFG